MRRSFARVLCRSRAFTRLRVPLARGIWGAKVARLEIRVATPWLRIQVANGWLARFIGRPIAAWTCAANGWFARLTRQPDWLADSGGERFVRSIRW